MEQRLSNLVSSLMRLADIRNLDDTNPVIITLSSEAGNPTIVIVSYYEPYIGDYPVNVSWINADPASAGYQYIYKRVDYTPDPVSGTNNTWQLLYYYNDVFNPPQYYLGQTADQITQEILAHIADITTNPHHVTAVETGALPLTGGTLTGDLLLSSLAPVSTLSAVPKSYVDDQNAILATQLGTLNVEYSNVNASLSNLLAITIPSLQNNEASLTSQYQLLNATVDSLVAALGHISLSTLVDDVNTLKQQEIDLNARLTTLENGESGEDATLSNLVSEVAVLQSNYTTLNGSVASLLASRTFDEAKLVDYGTRITALENLETTTLANITTSINQLTTEYQTLETQVLTLNTEYTQLNTQVIGLSSEYTSLSNNVLTLNSQYNNLNSEYITLNSNVNALTLELVADEQILNSYGTRIFNLETKLVTDEANISNLLSRVTTLETGENNEVDTANIAQKFVYIQSIAEQYWTITHTLNTSNVFVSVIANGQIIMPNAIDVVNATTITIEFNVPISGSAIIIG